MNDDIAHSKAGRFAGNDAGESHRREVDIGTESVSEELVETVATLEGTDPRELAVLSRSVDPDALDALFEPRLDGTPRTAAGEVRFDYEGYAVRVGAEGEITLEPTE